ncbi:MAG: hypothetical protein O7F12_17425 [Nitrospirae bacterium]|nr:hypothetical protein [Nitrospirota bacterium]
MTILDLVLAFTTLGLAFRVFLAFLAVVTFFFVVLALAEAFLTFLCFFATTVDFFFTLAAAFFFGALAFFLAAGLAFPLLGFAFLALAAAPDFVGFLVLLALALGLVLAFVAMIHPPHYRKPYVCFFGSSQVRGTHLPRLAKTCNTLKNLMFPKAFPVPLLAYGPGPERFYWFTEKIALGLQKIMFSPA